MNTLFTILLLLSISLSVLSFEAEMPKRKCHLTNTEAKEYAWDLEKIPSDQLPTNFTWQDVNGKNWLSQSTNQHIPKYCGACWIFGATSHLSDRLNIARGATFPEVRVSPQILLDYDMYDNGCHGGDAIVAMKWIKENGVQDESCSQYRAEGHDEPTSNTQPKCKTCNEDYCYEPDHYNTYELESYGSIPGGDIEAMQTEIITRGPIFCSVNAVPMETDVPYGFDGVLTSDSKVETDHIIVVVGWGYDEVSGLDYWVVKNSWGEYFGNNGFVKVQKGVNALWIEQYCGYGVVKAKWSNERIPDLGAGQSTDSKKADSGIEIEKIINYNVADRLLKPEAVVTEYKKSEDSISSLKASTLATDFTNFTPMLKTPSPSTYLSTSNLPARFWWGNKDGVNYLSWVLNQNIPQYCASSHIFAAISSLSDRINISSNNLFRTVLSAQQVLDCGVGSCSTGGSIAAVHEHAATNGLTMYGCKNYQATSPKAGEAKCNTEDNCMNCWGTADAYKCWGVKKHVSFVASEYGVVSGVLNMKKEILARGPIACRIMASDRFFFSYRGGVWRESLTDGAERKGHGVSVVGWGMSEQDGEFWVARNSWGTYWGEEGYFRIPTGENSLGIEQDCHWAVVESVTQDPEIVEWINKP